MSVIEEIAAERKRQIDVEGWTPAHDDEHIRGELARGAAFYALVSAFSEGQRLDFTRDRRDLEPVHTALRIWPEQWDMSWLKLKTPRRDLIRAAALILAEIERLDRLNA